jgi:hypothetical protein
VRPAPPRRGKYHGLELRSGGTAPPGLAAAVLLIWAFVLAVLATVAQ